jgi:hypothetical protein
MQFRATQAQDKIIWLVNVVRLQDEEYGTGESEMSHFINEVQDVNCCVRTSHACIST